MDRPALDRWTLLGEKRNDLLTPLSAESGLDLRGTTPPVAQILRFSARTFGSRPVLIAVQVADRVQQDSLAEVTGLLEWSALTMYDLNAPGHQPGVLLGTLGWSLQ
jgi:hypothetical protein